MRNTTRTNTAVAAGLLALTALLPQTAAHAAPARPAGAPLGACAAGELCLWTKPDFTGTRRVHELSGTDIESCVALPRGADAQSLANRTGRPVTTYQSAECAETGEFDTYPSGAWAPGSPYRVRAFKIWEN
ncbi:peptidase inhibitor family I36 protein [Streptomyces sp. NPDC050504]|uniref:peptidase inhibitor family I36 protein n=1 Tax=Streptomyces sp. NPDC050504 TaxID=3365618 RepID=UPI0037A299BA